MGARSVSPQLLLWVYTNAAMSGSLSRCSVSCTERASGKKLIVPADSFWVIG